MTGDVTVCPECGTTIDLTFQAIVSLDALGRPEPNGLLALTRASCGNGHDLGPYGSHFFAQDGRRTQLGAALQETEQLLEAFVAQRCAPPMEVAIVVGIDPTFTEPAG